MQSSNWPSVETVSTVHAGEVFNQSYLPCNSPLPPPPPIKLVAGETESEAAEFWWRQRNDDDVASVDKDDWVEWFIDDYSMGQLWWWWI